MAAIGEPISDAATEPLTGEGEMAARVRAYDWAATPLGPRDAWPQSLRTVVSLCLASRFPMLIWWGPELVMLYNDAYRPILGASKHPSALGQRGRACWPEIWEVIGTMLHMVLDKGQATWSDDQLLLLDRNGYSEECYFTFSYSPIGDESGGVGGVFTAVSETTERVLGERRMRTLRDLAARTAGVRGAEAVCVLAAQTLGENPADVPFAALYLPDGPAGSLRLAASAGQDPALVTLPTTVPPEEDGVWPLTAVARTGEAVLVERPPSRNSTQDERALPHRTLILPVLQAGQSRPAALLVVGVSGRRVLDAGYRDFFDLVAGHIGAALAAAHAYEEERQRAEALAELDRAKTAFFSNVSHEFRTPLTLLLGPLEEALAAPPSTPLEEERAHLESAHRNSLRLLRLVNTLLDFARIEAGRADTSFAPTDLAALTADLAGSFRSAVERAGLRLVVECPPLPEPVYVDQQMWEKIVLNLLANAFKFTFAGEIAVSLHAEDGAVRLAVRDSGIGIPTAELPRIFERFHRVREARARTHEGSGIGLALVRELVLLHGGEIQVESTEGRGTTFSVRLPLGSVHLPPERIGAARTLASTAVSAAPFVEEARRWLPEEPEAAGPPAGTLARLLVADDNADMRAYLRRLLGTHYIVETVPDGAAALATALAEPPDLILADVMMPELDGFALLRALRADPRTRTLPVILLSARAGEEASAEGLEAGADDYLVKPFTAGDLLARVRAHLALARLRHEARDALAVERDRLQGEVEARIQAEAALRRQAALIDLAHDAIIVRSPAGRILGWNEGAVALYGWTAAEAMGRITHEVLRTRILGSPAQGSETDALIAVRGAWEGELEHTRRDGTPVVVESRQALLRTADGTPEAILEVNRDMAAHRALSAALARLHTIQAVSDTALAQLALPDLLRQILDRITEALAADNTAILLLDETEHVLTVHAARGPEEAQVAVMRVPVGQGVAGRIAATRQPLILSDVRQAAPVNPLLREQVASLMGVPLLVEDRLIGVMHVDSLTPRRFSEDDLQLLQLVGDRVALALENARLYQRALARATELETLLAVLPIGIGIARDPAATVIQVNEAFARMLALPPDANASLSAPQAERPAFRVYKEGRELAPEELPIQMAAAQGRVIRDLEVEVVQTDGARRTLLEYAAPLRDEAGKVRGAIGAFIDLTERKQLERRTHQALEALLALAQTLAQAPEEAAAPRLADLAHRVLDAASLCLALPDPASGTVQIRAVAGDGAEGARWRAALAEIRLADLLSAGAGLRGLAGDGHLHLVPLVIDAAPIGALGVVYEREPTAEDQALVAAVAHLLALLLGHARLLHEREEALAAEMAQREINRQMGEFLHLAAHELRSPLTSIKGALQLGRRRLASLAETVRQGDDTAAARLTSLVDLFAGGDRQVERLGRLVGDLLDVSRLEAGHFTTVLAPIDLAALVRETAQGVRRARPARAIELASPPDPVLVEADADRIEQVLVNFITNALKYSPPDRPVRVYLALDGAQARVSVQDEGPGLRPEQQMQVWERYARLEGVMAQDETVQAGGLGLGLYLCRSIVERHGGLTGVESTPGAGSTFWFTLPHLGATPGAAGREKDGAGTPAAGGREP